MMREATPILYKSSCFWTEGELSFCATTQTSWSSALFSSNNRMFFSSRTCNEVTPWGKITAEMRGKTGSSDGIEKFSSEVVMVICTTPSISSTAAAFPFFLISTESCGRINRFQPKRLQDNRRWPILNVLGKPLGVGCACLTVGKGKKRFGIQSGRKNKETFGTQRFPVSGRPAGPPSGRHRAGQDLF